MKKNSTDHNVELSRMLEAVRELAIENRIADGTLPEYFDIPFGVDVVENEITRILQDLTKMTRDAADQLYEASLVKVAK